MCYVKTWQISKERSAINSHTIKNRNYVWGGRGARGEGD